MIFKTSIYTLGAILLISCNNIKSEAETKDATTKTFKLTDSSRAKLINALDSIAISNSDPDDITISGRFINQGKYDRGEYYLTIETEKDSSLILINPMPLKETEISKLKKVGDNITLTYSQSSKTVKFLVTNFDPE